MNLPCAQLHSPCACAACERHNETEKALDLLECMHRAGFAASYANYSSIIMQVLLHGTDVKYWPNACYSASHAWAQCLSTRINHPEVATAAAWEAGGLEPGVGGVAGDADGAGGALPQLHQRAAARVRERGPLETSERFVALLRTPPMLLPTISLRTSCRHNWGACNRLYWGNMHCSHDMRYIPARSPPQ
jgi:hypothetical protein